MLSNEFKDAEIEISENALQVIMSIEFSKDVEEFERNGIAVSVESYENNKIKVVFNTGAVPQNMFTPAVSALKKALI